MHGSHKWGYKVALVGYSDASFAPFGGKSFGASTVVLGRTPIVWKAGKQTMVSMSVCEAELMESATCNLLLESVGAIVGEITGQSILGELRIDNAAAGGLLIGTPGSWRTRHLRIRHSYVLDKVASGNLVVRHVPGDLQLADLPTKLHPRQRLMELLRLWAMFGIPELDRMHAAEDLRLCYLVLAMVALMSIGVDARKVTDTGVFAKEPLATTGTMELLLCLTMWCVVAVVCWEIMKALWSWCSNRCFGSKRDRKLKRLRRLAQLATEAELERTFEGAEVEMDDLAHGAVSDVVKKAMTQTAPTTTTTTRATQTDEIEPDVIVREKIVKVPEFRDRERIVQVPREVRVEVPVMREDSRYERLNEVYMTENGCGSCHTSATCQGFEGEIRAVVYMVQQSKANVC